MLPDRTLCWVEGPPWDRTCDPVGSVLPAEEHALDKELLRRRLERLSNSEVGVVLAIVLRRLDDLGTTPLPDLMREMADQVDGILEELDS